MQPWGEGLPRIWEQRKVDLSFIPIAHSLLHGWCVTPACSRDRAWRDLMYQQRWGVGSFRLRGLWSW